MSNLAVFNQPSAQLALVGASLQQVKVVSTETAKVGHDIMNEASRLEKEIERLRKEAVKPLNDEVKRINDYAKSLVAPIAPGLQGVKRQLADWEMKLQKEREAARKKAEEERLAAEEALRAEAAKEVAPPPVEEPGLDDWDNFGGEPAAIDLELQEAERKAELDRKQFEIDQAHARAVSEANSNRVKGARRKWSFEIQDAGQVPREFLVVDEKLIRAAIADGTREIPGVRIFEDVIISARGR